MGELSDVMQMLNRQQPGVHHNVSGSQMNSEDSLQQKISWVGNMDRDTSGLCAGHRQQVSDLYLMMYVCDGVVHDVCM